MSSILNIYSHNPRFLPDRFDPNYFAMLLWVVRLSVPALLLSAVVYLDRVNYRIFIEEERADLARDLGLIRSELEGNISANIQAVRGLVAAIVTEPDLDQKRFGELASVVLENRPQLRNLGAAPDLVIEMIYPLEGNRSALGLDFRTNAEQWPAVKKAADEGQLVLSGPVDLVQGGRAFIGRVPVLLPQAEDGTRELWGLISAVIDIEPLYRSSGLLAHPSLDLALRKQNPETGQSDVFFGRQELFADSAVTLPISLPGVRWQLAGRPAGGWPSSAENAGVMRTLWALIFFAVTVPVLWLTWSIQRQRVTRKRLQALFELSPIGIALNDFDTGAFIDANEVLVASTGYTREEFLALSYWQLTPKEYQEQEQEQLDKLRKTGRYGPYEKEYLRKNGERYPVLLSGMLVRDSSGKWLIWSMIEDISERKRIERMKSDFVSTVSHELRTPLTSISGTLSLIKGGALGEVPAGMQELLDIASRNSRQLTRLIDDLLDMDKLLSGKMRFDFHWVELTPLLQHSLDANRGYAQQYQINLELDNRAGSNLVRVDQARFEQVMANLLSNAIKFSPEQSSVKVISERIGAWVRVSVKDTGPGVPDEFRERIFEKFSQADSSDSRRKGGTGLGLAICRELVERMGGKIGFTSEAGRGACFYFDLPLAEISDG